MKPFYLSRLIIPVILLLGINYSAFAQTYSTSGTYNYTVPAGCQAIQVDMAGAQGGGGGCGTSDPGGKGGRVQCILAASVGQVLNINVGGVGTNSSYTLSTSGPAGGFNGGGNGTYGGAAGGGCSDIRIGGTSPSFRVIVAGGGGGGATDYCNDAGAPGGGLIAANGTLSNTANSSYAGQGGNTTTNTGGAGASFGGGAGTNNNGTATAGYGGNAYAPASCCYYGGGGGGGYCGGGGGYYGSGGGGSSYTSPTLVLSSSVVHTPNYQTSNGYVNLTPLLPIVIGAPGSLSFGNVTVGTTSVPALFTSLTGLYLTNNPVVITSSCPSLYIISLDGATWGSSVTVNPVPAPAGGIGYTLPANSNVFVKFRPAVAGLSSGCNLTITGGGMPTAVNIPLSGTGANVCTGAGLFAGVTSITPAAGNQYTNFTLSLASTSGGGGLNYQWQSAPTPSGPWTNIPGAITSSYTFLGISATTYYQAIVSCPAGGAPSTSVPPATATYASTAASGCTPTASQPNNCCNFVLGNPSYPVQIVGDAGSTISDSYDPQAIANQTNHYVDNTATMNVNMSIGQTYGGISPTVPTSAVNLGIPNSNGQIGVQIWIDFNNDGSFAASEIVGGGNYSATLATYEGHPQINLQGPGITPGKYRMRVIETFTQFNAPPGTAAYPAYPGLVPCPTTTQVWADARDYAVTISFPPCSGVPYPGIADASVTTGCADYATNLFNIGQQVGPGITYQWYTSSDGGLTYGSVGSGGIGSIYTPTITTGTTYFKMQLTCANSGGTAFTNPVVVNRYVPPSPIVTSTGAYGTCTGLSTLLASSVPTGGTWSSSNNAVIAIGSITGAITGVTVGVANITYTLPTSGCYATTPITVNQLPGPITGTREICQNSCTTLSNAIPGGAWTGFPSTLVTVGSASGNVCASVTTGGSPTFPTITYTLPTGCLITSILTVDPMPPQTVVSGGGNYCTGGTSTLHVYVGAAPNPPSAIGMNYQLMLSGSVLATVAGTGSAIDFGVQSAAGTYTVIATNTTTGCTRSMIGAATININPLPLIQTIGGGGSFCVGGAGRSVNITNTQLGIKYYLMLGSSVQDSLLGTGTAISFNGVSTPGIYTVIASSTTSGCAVQMTGSIPVIANPAPNAFDVTGGGTYCVGASGMPVYLSFSNTGINYQLMNGSTSVGAPIPGTGGPLSFGIQSAPGLYTVLATNASTGCTGTMNYSATIAVKGLPVAENVAGGGHFCAGSAGPEIKVAAPTEVGISYQLFLGGTPVGSPVIGTGLDAIMGNPTVPGTYTVVGTDLASSCTSNMNGSATVIMDPLPNAWSVGGGGNYCNGAAGAHITLGGSNTGITYYLIQAGDTVGTQSGTGAAIDFGTYTTAGVYSAVAVNNLSGCMRNMTGVASIGLNPLPGQFNVTGTGNYCLGTTGQVVGLDFSNTGISYQLYRGVTAVGSPVTGTGAPISFGPQTIPGTYTVVATNTSTSCVNTMAGNAVVGVNPLPTLHLVTGGGSYCSGGSGVNVNLNGSDVGMIYQLYLGVSPVGSAMAGTGLPISFGLQTAGGNYTIMAMDATTSCSRFMAGNANVVVNALPTAYSVTGGGIFCSGASGLHVGLSGSAIGIKYQLYKDGTPVGSLITGSGGTIDFGSQVAPGTYTAVGNNATTGCSSAMSSSTVIATQPLPAVYAVTGGGAYCAGGSGFDISIANSDPGINYQLYHGSAIVGSPLGGIGSALSFGTQTASGNYTVIATDGTTGCVKTMGGSAVITINPLPAPHTVLGGGNYCTGGTGVHIFLGTSNPGVNYQLFNGSTPGISIAGTGSTLDFGLNTDAGTYTIVADNATTGCSNNMTGSATIGINPLPSDFSVTGGGSYCLGGSGVSIGLGGSESGVRYQLYNGTTSVGLPVMGSGSAFSFGSQTVAGTYTVYAINASTTCANTMTTSANISINPLPATYTVTGGGNYCATGIGVHVNLSNSEVGINYQLYYGGTATGIPVPGTGGVLDLGLQTAAGVYTVMASNGTTSCADAMTGSTTVNIIPVVLPAVNITPSAAGVICADQLVHFTAVPVNGGSAPTYQWAVNGITTGVGSSYSYIPVDGDVLTARIHSNAQCAIPDTGSGRMTLTVSPLEMPSATVTASPGSVVCTGALTSFTATTLYGGTSPVLSWLKNGVAVASGLTYAYIPTDGDVITFELGSNFNCRLADNVFSAPIALTVQNPVLPTVSVVSSSGGTIITPGQSVTFTATATHAGPNPMYQWVINSVPVHGATNATFTTNTLNNRDSVSCAVTGICDMVGFNSLIVSVRTTNVKQITSNGGDVKLIPNPNKGEFSLKGTLGTSLDEEAVVEITDMIGQVVYTNKVMTHGGNIDEHISLNKSLANGMYILNLRSGSENTVFHFVIEK
jgi:hypothetical protein